MRKSFALAILSALVLPMCAFAQKNSKPSSAPVLTEWSDPDVFEQHKLYPRVNVTGFQYENDIEKGAYRMQPYYVSLAGKWQFDLQKSVSARPDMENKKLDVSKWAKVTVPDCRWKDGGAWAKAPEVSNVVDLPDRGNYVATYYREFNTSSSWKGYEAFLQVQGRSAYYIWINNEYVGYSEDSRALSEFNVTSHLKLGKANTIAIQVVATSDGSLLESDCASSVLGLTHDVAIVLKPTVNINDFRITTDCDAKSRLGELQVTATVANKSKKGLYYIETEIWTPQGKQLDKMAKWVAFDNRSEVEVTLKRDFADVDPWTAETPNLYTLIVRLRDDKMNLVETTGSRFGFRKVQLDGSELLVNGEPVKLRGVAYANYDHATGGEPTYEQMERDLKLMKRYNINAIRTAVYSPADDEFYSLCDKYGFYVLCEANIQPYSTQKKAVATDGDYENLFIARVQNMYEPLKNHPSIIAWSLGSGRDNGVCMERAYAALKQKDKERPVLFAGAGYSSNTDIVALSETDPESLKAAAVKRQARPLLIYSFGSVEGNNFGGMETAWRSVADNSKFLGAFMPWWSSVMIHDAKAKNDSLCLGFRLDSGKDVPFLAELGNIYRPFDVRLTGVSQDACEFVITCRSGVQNPGNYVLEYNMFSNLKPHIVGGEIELAIEPGGSKSFKLKMPVLNLYIAEELFVRFSVKQRVKSPAVPQGTTLASVEMPLPVKKIKKVDFEQQGVLSLAVENAAGNKKGTLKITGPRFALKYDLANADITKYSYDGVELLSAPLRSTVSRPPTCNDTRDRNGNLHGGWMKYNDKNLTRTVRDVNYRANDDSTVVIDAMVSYSLHGVPVYDLKQTIAVLSSGDVVIDNSLTLDNSVKCVARIGFETQVPNSLATVNWFGRKNETYVDRCSAGDIGSYSEQSGRMAFDYTAAQSSGNRADTRWFALHNGTKGLFVDMIDTSFGFAVCNYTDRQLEEATSSSSLKPGGSRAVHIDFRMSGVGSAAAGYHTADAALLKDRKYRFKLHLRGYDQGDNNAEDFRRIAYPVVESGVLPMPVVNKDRDRFNAPMSITITSTVPDAEIRYTLDGSEPNETSPLYSSPFKISSSTVVSARAYKKGYAASFVTRAHFSFDYVKSVTFDHKPNTPYNHNFQTALYDGETGEVNNLSAGWLGFSASDLAATLELTTEINLESVELRFAHNPDAWAFAPTAVDIMVSTDGVAFSDPIPAKITYDPQSNDMNTSQLVNIKVIVDKPGVKYVKVVAKNMGRIPSWHKNKGLRPWLMTDEIILNEVIGK